MKSIPQLFFILAVSLFSLQSLALSTDRDQPADIEADDIEFDFKQGLRTYQKNVIIVQGTLRISADSLVTKYQDGELTEATAIGSLARFKQRPDDKPDDVEGWAEKIVVDQKNNIMTLYGQAALKQGADTARGETIIYNMANDTLKVQGGAKIATSGADNQPRPERKLEDPFKNDPAPVSSSATSVTPSNGAASATEAAPKPANTSDDLAPLPSGRSRLIIQPK